MLALLKATAPMPESTLFDKKYHPIMTKWRSERSLLWTTIACHKLHASAYDTIVSIHTPISKQDNISWTLFFSDMADGLHDL